VLGDFGWAGFSVANLNLSLIRQITRINSDIAESSKETLVRVISVCACSIKSMKPQKLDRFINCYLLCSYWNYYG
jgi:hypothetical protein